jgi:chromate transporter
MFLTFAKIGLFTFGGGYAMLPMLQSEVVEKKHWATEDDLMDYFAVGQCTPGVIAVNTASFIGFYKKGILGSIVATAGVISPSIVIILLIASLLSNFAELDIVQHALAGIRIAVCVLIFKATLKMAKSGIKDVFGILLFCAVLVASYFSIVPTIAIIIISAAAGVLVKLVQTKKKVS